MRPQGAPARAASDREGCEALFHLRNLTITHAGLSETGDGVPYCYVRGILPPAIHFHVQLPLPGNWNGRFLKWGDGGKDGDLDFADHRVVEGYAVANSNTGHDNGAEPGSSFAYDNRQAEIDFGYRAVHLTVAAAKTVVRSYYGDDPAYSDFEGCSTGGRQGLMEAQRYPTDFDGIVAGAPANHYQEMNAVRVWLLQRMLFIPYTGNRFAPGAVRLGGDHLNYLFYETDPGVPPADLLDTSTAPDRKTTPPEWAWWQFDIDDVTAGKGDLMKRITDAVDPDLSRFLLQQDAKLILYHGWADALVAPQPTVAYYQDVIETTFAGDVAAARERARLFMAPGMNHCRGGAGPDTWDRLRPLVDWVERGAAPGALSATHATGGVVDNERPICAFPERAVYTGPAGGADDPANWVAGNFTCR